MKDLFVQVGNLLLRYLSFWHLKRILIFLAVDVVLMTFVKRSQSDAIFVLRFDLLGDYIIGRNFLRAIRNYPPYQFKKIILCTNIALKDLLELYDADVFDEFIWVDRTKLLNEFWYRFQILRQIRKLGAQIAICPIYFREPYMGDCLMWATGAKERIGREMFQNPLKPSNKYEISHATIGDVFYTRLLKEDQRIVFDFYRNQSFFSSILPGVVLPANTRLTPIPTPLPEIKGSFAALLPGASEAFREWPPERLAQVAQYLFSAHGLRTVIIGTRSDATKALIMKQSAPEVPMDDLCGRLTLPQVVYLMSQCKIGITNDSGGIHLLAALNKPGVAISKTHSFGLFHPYPKEISKTVTFVYPPVFYSQSISWEERKETYSRKKFFEITDISSTSVIERVEALLLGKSYYDPVQEQCNQN